MAVFGSRLTWIIIIVIIAIYYNYDGSILRPADIRGKRVLITGSSSGIGEEMAYQYCKMGAAVMLTARRSEVLKQVAIKCKELGAKKVEYFAADMSKSKDRENLVNETSNKLGGLDYLILNHAIFYFEMWENSVENVTSLQTAMNVNFVSFVDITSRSMPMLIKSNGSIGVVSSTAGRVPYAYSNFYSPSKFALNGFFSGFRLEVRFKEYNVSITEFVLGYIATDIAIEVQTTKFPNVPLIAAAVNETALFIIKHVQNRSYVVYYPKTEWYFAQLYNLLPKIGDIVKLKILEYSLPSQ